MNSAILLILTGQICWHHLTANFFTAPFGRYKRSNFGQKHQKSGVFTTFYSMNIDKKNLHSQNNYTGGYKCYKTIKNIVHRKKSWR